ncbi:tetratricopeptide repeat protein [Palleronia sp. KMU-117]|uniref:tetratricopeptide repeat protein n=1 Tax=Palleronia sp. KMU-117 TaxID=3434108 RepID=UPI003D70F8E0
MRHAIFVSLCLGSAVALSACDKSADTDVERAIDAVNVIDESGLNDVMLQAADPEEAVNYFVRASTEQPDRIDLQRGLALALIRAKRPREAAQAWERVVSMPDATPDDRLGYADALIRNGDWDEAEAQLDKIPPTFETFQRYRLEAMVADSNKEWQKADSFYEIAVGLTTRPGGVLNNWGYSKLSRGDFAQAEKLFAESIGYDPSVFTTKNNLVLARGAQRKYDMPIIPMTQTEKAQLLHTLALSAIKQGDVTTGKALLNDAIETHPQHFEAAVRSLEALEGNVRG